MKMLFQQGNLVELLPSGEWNTIVMQSVNEYMKNLDNNESFVVFKWL